MSESEWTVVRGGRKGNRGSSNNQNNQNNQNNTNQNNSTDQNNYNNNNNNNNNNDNNYSNNNNNHNNNNYRRGGRRNDRQGYNDLVSGPQNPYSKEELEEFRRMKEERDRQRAQTDPRKERKVDHNDNDDEDWKAKLKVPEKDTRIRTEDVLSKKGLQWEDLDLKRNLLKGIYEAGFERPSPVQEESIPYALMDRHVLARAKNGTGKTGSFVIPALQRCDSSLTHIQALILVPTRELALQTSSVVKKLGKYLNLNVIVTTGGTNLKDDIIRLMDTVHVVVATPGRILDLCKRDVAKLHKARTVALDEADKLLSVEFVPVIKKVLSFTSRDRRIFCFSASFPKTVKSFVDEWMPKCRMVNLMDELTLKGVTQYYVYIDEKYKVRCLKTLFGKLNINQCIVFCKSVARVELLSKRIVNMGVSCYYSHSRMPQEDRNRVFHDFREGLCRYLVCTDLFTRGIDIPTVNVVVNFDFPKSSESYLHRIGRSGRFGHLGLAINFVTEKDKESLELIERELDTSVKPFPSQVDPALYCK